MHLDMQAKITRINVVFEYNNNTTVEPLLTDTPQLRRHLRYNGHFQVSQTFLHILAAPE